MVNPSQREYDGSRRLIVRTTLLTTHVAVDKAIGRINLRFTFLEAQRLSLKADFEAAEGLQRKGEIVDADKAVAAEMENLSDMKVDLLAKRRELFEEREEEISSYSFEPVALEADEETDQHSGETA